MHKNTAQFLAFLTLVIGMMSQTNSAEPELWPISVEGKWGYINSTGKVVIKPQYAKADQFSEGLAVVSVFGTSETDRVFDRTYDGFIDKNGEFVIPARLPDFYNKREAYDSYGYSSFEDGVAVVRDASSSSGLKGLIDRTGKLVAPMKFSSFGWSFSQGLTSFQIGNGDGSSERGYMDYTGKVVLRPKHFLYGDAFYEDRASITIRDESDDYVTLIDLNGNQIVAPGTYTAISGVRGGLCRVYGDGKVGLVDRNGKVVIRPGEYEQITEPDPGTVFIGEKQGRFYSISLNADATVLPDFGAEPIRYRDELIWVRKNEKNGFVKPDGTVIVECRFDDLSKFNGELAEFRDDSGQGYVNREGAIVWSTSQWELPLQYSIRNPLKSYLPDFSNEAKPLSYNWDCENAIVFVCDGNLERLRKFYLSKRSDDVEVKDYTDYGSEPGKINMMISFDGVAYLEVYAMQGDAESEDSEDTDYFVSFYHCESMDALRKKYPDKTVGIILEN